ncbi:hypothetical protein PCASD_07151 [Puccinia coronata f. sp. avenae]|uniref:Thioredoxin-like fold domain-containing protein n=1 Tax=Puccinia coronata f. sp. avenae TaxID=200324 RepID=A0A2N5V488_9BASI|nr:hypothetical protein PCASD_07151 [Puccinia coronata f. sp. avenae]
MATQKEEQKMEEESKQSIPHTDPIISRLLLNDQFGKRIQDQKQLFRDCKVVGFLFSAIWKHDRNAFQSHVIELCRRNPHRFKCVYVSIDSSKEDFERSTRDKPWLHMVWEDGSNTEQKKLDKVEFITPLEHALLKQILAGKEESNGAPPEQQARPFSRVGLCAGLDVLFAPTLMVYHLESQTWLDRNVAHSAIGSREKREAALETWEKGESLSLSWTDILFGLKWAILVSAIGIGYFLLSRADPSYNIVHLVEWFMAGSSSATTTTTTTTTPSSPSPPKPAHQYVEF